ncbi:ABC transporter ATP-binding protein [Nordella sp. HKS 07]|uniref:ABC transporter ATP-binding protein n=1 Tax=Nordella sp. HKS 07 TaxID=2712222 RepID=UPI0013E115DA|nr:ABC transporter ATP-binding protein [Nordella sp. HKS 07]QIG49099.1 ABC transporter ATP-binding protein [Nordella sp. HKS 07]
MSRLLAVKGLTTGYRQIRVLHDVSFEIERGGITAIIGPNGHGKSTLLRTISGLLPAWSGAIEFDGATVANGAPRRAQAGLVLVPQGDQLFAGMTVEENLMMGGYVRKEMAEVRHTLAEVFELFPRLHERRAQHASSLSGGERRMVGIGRGLMAKAKLIMIDEPSLGLAPLIIEQIYAALSALAARGQSILVVEENPGRVAKVASSFHLMDGGRFTWSGSAADLLRSGHMIKTYLGGN